MISLPLLVQILATNNKYVVLMDPLDGSSNIDGMFLVGTIFQFLEDSLEPCNIEDFFAARCETSLAAGYVIYGTLTMLVYTTNMA